MYYTNTPINNNKEQRLLPPDEPLRFTLKYRHRR